MRKNTKLTAGTILALLELFLEIAGGVLYIVYVTKNGWNLFVAGTFVLAIASTGLYLVKPLSWLPVLSTALIGAALGMYLYLNYGTYVDYFNGVRFFGDVTQIGNITATVGTLLAAGILAVILSFFKDSASKNEVAAKKSCPTI